MKSEAGTEDKIQCPRCGYIHQYARETCPHCGASEAYEEYPASRRTRIAVGCFMFALGSCAPFSIKGGASENVVIDVLTGIICGSLLAWGFDKYLCGPAARKRK